MRATDQPLPTVTLDNATMLASWPVRPVIAIEQRQEPPYAWGDGSVWDDPAKVWDAAVVAPLFRDATCDWTGLTLEAGPPDDSFHFPATRLLVQLDNANGSWSRYNLDGSPAVSGAGELIHLYAHNATGNWWLFSGRIARWDQRADDTIECEAFDIFSDLAQPIGTFTPGAAGDRPGPRQTAILNFVPVSPLGIPKRFATGTVALTAQPTDKAPLEEMQVVVESDGGLLYADADGTLVSTDRFWRSGRADQITEAIFSDNVCEAPFGVWDPLLSTSDTALADVVVLTNLAGLTARATATVPEARFVLTATAQQWTTQGEGDTLAAQLLAVQSRARVAVDEATIYLLDPYQPDNWRCVDWRRLDRIRFLHDQKVVGGTSRLDLEMLVLSLNHEITPEGWTFTFSTTRTQTFNSGIDWDTTPLLWDSTAPAATWGY